MIFQNTKLAINHASKRDSKDTNYLQEKIQRNVLLCTFDLLTTSVTLHNGLNLESLLFLP